MINEEDKAFVRMAIEAANDGMDANEGGPFGAVIVKNGQIVAKGNNQVTSTNDPTAHAEVVAIRRACEKLGTFQLDGCTLYSSCEPCPMCLGAIYWARPSKLVFACSKKDAAAIHFDDDFIYEELGKALTDRSIPTFQLLREEGLQVFEKWASKQDKISY